MEPKIDNSSVLVQKVEIMTSVVDKQSLVICKTKLCPIVQIE